jgi:iron complex transport system ATP-binding protein
MKESPYLSTEQLSVGFLKPRNNILFENLDLELYRGRLVCFMGPNGIGKSTLIRTLASLQKPLSGNVKIPESPEKVSTNAEQVAVVLTTKSPLPAMNVYEMVSFGRYPYLGWNISLTQADHRIIKSSLRSIGIEHLADSTITELSDGQLQMVMIARAVCQETPIILLDEPTAHLDLNNRLEIMKHLKRFSREMNKAILISTHELDLALQIADEVWLATRDKRILRGTPEDLVLNGSFDEIFQFKGFDLRTGKVAHQVSQAETIEVMGEGHTALWTINALERSGFQVKIFDAEAKQHPEVKVMIEAEESGPRWILLKDNQQFVALTIADLVERLQSNDCKIPE